MKSTFQATRYWLAFTVGLGFMCLFTFRCGLFDRAKTEVGFRYYAENPVAVGAFRIMPFNAAVNLGYVVVGVYWFRKAKQKLRSGDFGSSEFVVFTTLCWMSVVYGPIQLYRIASQTHRSAVLDQWVTLPFFAWTAIACHCFATNRWSHIFNFHYMTLSLATYTLTLFTPMGFELALSLHIVATVLAALHVIGKYGNWRLVMAFLNALLFCAGFVMLKLSDMKLSQRHPLFTVLTGHFLSKLCDILQIHFAFVFFKTCVKIRKSKIK